MLKSVFGGLPSLILMTAVASAHTGLGVAEDHVHGFMHPLGGLDHILAMVTVGLFAYQLGGRSLWSVPLTFVVVMALAGSLGAAGVQIPFVEIGIALSVVVLGAIVALSIKAPAAAAMGLAGLFAIFHGYAHGAELPPDTSGLGYAVGFMTATALLHALGVGVGFGIGRLAQTYGRTAYRVTGGMVTAAGLGLLAGVI